MRGRFFLAVLLSLLPVALRADGLSSLGRASEITAGTLPCGVSYYIVTNKESHGFADFAVIRKGEPDRNAARQALSDPSVFHGRKPYDFLKDRGVGCPREGFVSYRDDATIFSFRDVPVSDKAVADSTLMLLFGMMSSSKAPQAVIVSGDVQASDVKARMDLLSMMVPAGNSLSGLPRYVWRPQDRPTCYYTESRLPAVATLRITYNSPRVPADKMNTLQVNVTKLYSEYLWCILEKRIRQTFREEGIPLADLRFRYLDSSAGSGDEEYSITVITSSERYPDAVRICAEILSGLDQSGATAAELQDAKDRMFSASAVASGSESPDNHDYVSRCVAAWLYGAHLASDASIYDMFSRSRLPSAQELDIFNNFVSALLDVEKNLTLGFDSPAARRQNDNFRVFDSAWRSTKANPALADRYLSEYGDTLSLGAGAAKTKFRSEVKDPVSGGVQWTFTNGMKVIYKKTAAKGYFSYAWMLRGGFADVESLARGESAFVADMLTLSTISGMSGDAFKAMLAANGISMTQEVSLVDFRITGDAPSSKISLLLRSLLSLAGDRSPDRRAFDYYKSAERLRIDVSRLSLEGVAAYTDSLMAPAYPYSTAKCADALHNDILTRSHDYFEKQFSKCGDGVLVLLGDLDAEQLKKVLCQYLGGFRTSSKFALKPRAGRQLVAGTSTVMEDISGATVGDGSVVVSILQEAPLTFNMPNYASLRVVELAMRRQLARALVPLGYGCTVECTLGSFPQENAVMRITAFPCQVSGLPASVTPADPLEVLGVLRKVVSEAGRDGFDPEFLATAKSALASDIAAELSSQEGLMNAVLTRHTYNKDIVTGCQAQVSAVDAASVAGVLSALSAGGCIEYVQK